ncbi:MAG: MOSC domain-containing protein [Pseudomonadota bacterium]
MPALIATDHVATVAWLGRVEDMSRAELMAETVGALEIGWEGMPGSVHAGVNRPSCSRVTTQHPKGTEIRNVRQLSIVSAEELDEIAASLGVPGVAPGRLGASMVVRGIADFTHLPPSSRLQAPSGLTLVVDMLNEPCQFPARSLAAEHGEAAKGFKRAAEGRRGITAWVERPGPVTVGDPLRLHVPRQRAWAP